MSIVDVPIGFAPFDRSSPFLDRVGPLWVARGGARPVFGLRVADHHLNNRGTAHGGVLSTFADIVCGYTILWTREPAPNLTTVHLATEYLSAARHGEWLQGTAEVRARSARIACAHAVVHAGDRLVVQATGLFQARPSEGEDP